MVASNLLICRTAIYNIFIPVTKMGFYNSPNTGPQSFHGPLGTEDGSRGHFHLPTAKPLQGYWTALPSKQGSQKWPKCSHHIYDLSGPNLGPKVKFNHNFISYYLGHKI